MEMYWIKQQDPKVDTWAIAVLKIYLRQTVLSTQYQARNFQRHSYETNHSTGSKVYGLKWQRQMA